jgi:hypothetical protein
MSVDKKKLKDFIVEISNCMLRMDAERDMIKEILQRGKEELEMQPKVIRAMARIYHKNSLMEEKMTSEEIFDLYEETFSKPEENS